MKKETVTGVLRIYPETQESMKSDKFSIEDTDGMGLVLDVLRRFDGKEVIITVQEK